MRVGGFFRVKIGRAKLSTTGNGSDGGRELFVIPSVASLKAAQFLACDPTQDRVGEVIDLLVRGEADLRMGLKLGGKPGGPAFGRANADKIDVGHMRHQWRSPSESTRRRNYSIVSRRFAFAFFTGRQICISLFDLTGNELAHRGQHIFERRAVDFPDGQE